MIEACVIMLAWGGAALGMSKGIAIATTVIASLRLIFNVSIAAFQAGKED